MCLLYFVIIHKHVKRKEKIKLISKAFIQTETFNVHFTPTYTHIGTYDTTDSHIPVSFKDKLLPNYSHMLSH